MAEPHRIFLIEDHELVRDGIARIIRQSDDLEVAGSSGLGAEALKQIAVLEPDLVLVDLDLPDIHGLEVIQRLKQTDLNCKTAILSMHNEKAMIERAMEVGASGYFIKTVDEFEFLQGVRMICAGKKYFHSEAVTELTSTRSSGTTAGAEKHRLDLLSPREQDILKLVGNGLTTREIADQLFLSERTVETHRRNIHQKLDIKNLAGLIRFAIKSGLIS